MSASSNVLKEVHGRVALLIINRPEKRNALDGATRAQLIDLLDEGMSDEELEVGMSIIDKNHDGRISFQEFVAWWTDR